MLDDLSFIHQRDAHDALGIVSKQAEQLSCRFEIGDWKPAADIANIVHSGMGGSALWALMALSYPGFRVPFEVLRDYSIPAHVDEHTLFIAASYSGNTEETLSSLAEAEKAGAQIVVMTSGGKLQDIAREKGYLLLQLPPTNGPPRYGAFNGFKALVTLADHLKLSAADDIITQVESVGPFLQQSMAAWLPTVATGSNFAKQLATDAAGKSAVIYAGHLLSAAAHKWKIGFNENAKNVAWECTFPEFNHNEFTGWTSHPTQKPYEIFYLLSSFDNERVQKRFELSNKLLSGCWPAPKYVKVQGETPLEQLLWAVTLGDFVSLYVAFLNNTSPIEFGDDDIIERFKKELHA